MSKAPLSLSSRHQPLCSLSQALPASQESWADSTATTPKTAKIPRDVKEIHCLKNQCIEHVYHDTETICHTQHPYQPYRPSSLPYHPHRHPSSPPSRLDSCTCRSSKRRLSAVMAFPVHSAYLGTHGSDQIPDPPKWDDQTSEMTKIHGFG